MSDRERLLQALRDAGDRGVHTFDIRRSGISGNPSERVRELRRLGCTIRGEREKVGERWGKRFFLESEVGVRPVPTPLGAGPDSDTRLFDPPSRYDELVRRSA